MINRIIAIQGNHPSKLNPQTDTSIFLANEIQKKDYRIFITNQRIYQLLTQRLLLKVFLLNLIIIKKFLKY